ncbi:hypothetical protein BvCmsHHP056_03083 [Escherichia coli]|nr:hypothetical protein BvCmsHHP056_03083 [Escherichia coli]
MSFFPAVRTFDDAVLNADFVVDVALLKMFFILFTVILVCFLNIKIKILSIFYFRHKFMMVLPEYF